MLECLVIGDSIAVGYKHLRPECVAYAKGGITSTNWWKQYRTIDLTAKTVIISLGSNDTARDNSYHTLQEIRKNVKASKVYWILPSERLKYIQYYNVNFVASMYDDEVLKPYMYSPDGIHPTWAGYKDLVQRSRKNEKANQ